MLGDGPNTVWESAVSISRSQTWEQKRGSLNSAVNRQESGSFLQRSFFQCCTAVCRLLQLSFGKNDVCIAKKRMLQRNFLQRNFPKIAVQLPFSLNCGMLQGWGSEGWGLGLADSNTELSELHGPHRIPERELSEFLSVSDLCAKANLPSSAKTRALSLPQNSVSSLFQDSALETVFRSDFPHFAIQATRGETRKKQKMQIFPIVTQKSGFQEVCPHKSADNSENADGKSAENADDWPYDDWS